jgi:hypothetical protein
MPHRLQLGRPRVRIKRQAPLFAFGNLHFHSPSIQVRLRSGELAVTGLQWPSFLWVGSKCKEDDLWDGFMRSRLLLQVRYLLHHRVIVVANCLLQGIQTYFYVPKFRRRGLQIESLRKCRDSRHDICHSTVISLCRHSGEWSRSHPLLDTDITECALEIRLV